MKTWGDVVATAKAEVEKWFPLQCQNVYETFYWRYTPTTSKESPGKIWIGSESDPQGHIVQRLSIDVTKEQALYSFLEIARRLPILEP